MEGNGDDEQPEGKIYEGNDGGDEQPEGNNRDDELAEGNDVDDELT